MPSGVYIRTERHKNALKGHKPTNGFKKGHTINSGRHHTVETKNQQAESHKKENLSEQSIENYRKAAIQRFIDGKAPKLYTKPHRALHDAMIVSGLWSGFENEIVVGYHRIDICNVEKKIAILVDGDYYHANPKWYKIENYSEIQKNTIAHDKSCNTYLKNHGWIILRFWVSDIYTDLKKCLDKIKNT